MADQVVGGTLTLWGNLGPTIGYKVSTPASAAPGHLAAAGLCIAAAVLLAGYGVWRRRSWSGTRGRVAIIVIAGCLSVAWASAWLGLNSGRGGVIPADGVWNFAVSLPQAWMTVLALLLALMVARWFLKEPKI
ncbi:unnamed protein product [Gemmataceae bacterium]|nr:unnamed protein product [Gemmataceae bacterium]VTT96931.1 unnamed protein product [Gemmataceae bacterium]